MAIQMQDLSLLALDCQFNRYLLINGSMTEAIKLGRPVNLSSKSAATVALNPALTATYLNGSGSHLPIF